MITLFSWFLIPLSALCMSGFTDWFSTNYSVNANSGPGRYYLILWAFTTGIYFRVLIKKTVNRIASVLDAGTEGSLADLAVCLLLASVFLPYDPDNGRLAASVHVILAFTSTVLFYLVITSLDIRLYLRYPDCFSRHTWALVFAVFATILLLLVSDFIITSALELFLTIFASLWLYGFYGTVCRIFYDGYPRA